MENQYLQDAMQEGQSFPNVSAFPLGNSIIALAGEKFAMVVVDERSRGDTNNHARNQYKLFTMTEKSVLGSTVCWCEKNTTHGLMGAHVSFYEENIMKPMPTEELAGVIDKYSPRFFPNHKSNVFVGLDLHGKGLVFMYDTNGNFVSVKHHAAGLEGDYLSNILYNQIISSNFMPFNDLILSKEYAIALAVDCFRKIQDRGDQLLFNIVTEAGIENLEVSLEH